MNGTFLKYFAFSLTGARNEAFPSLMHVPNHDALKLWTNTDSSLLMAQFQETRCFPD